MRLLRVLFLFVVCITNGYSQKYKVSGIIKDSLLKEPLIGVNIFIINLNDSTKQGGYTDKSGYYAINEIAAGKCKMKISHIGYKSIEKVFEIKNRDIFFKEIFLTEDTIVLNEVSSIEKMPVVERFGDTINYNAKAFKVDEGAMVEDLLKKLPGVKIDSRSGKIKSENEEVKKVLVDGKTFFGDDVNAARKNIPANLISSVQVYNEESEQSRLTGVSTGETIKVINLVTKFRRGLSKGVFGKFSGSYGTEDKNLLAGCVNVFDSTKRITAIAMTNNMNINNFTDDERASEQLQNSRSNQDGRIIGVGLNYSNSDQAWLQFTGNYNYTSNRQNTYTSNKRYYYPINDIKRDYFEENNFINDYKNHIIGFRLNNQKKSLFQFSFSPVLSIRRSESISDMLSNSSLNDININQIKTNTTNKADNIGFKSDLILNQKLSESGRNISAAINVNLNNNEKTSDWNAKSQFYEESLANKENDLLSISKKDESIFSANLLYTEPIGQFHALQFGYMPSYEIRESDKRGYNLIENNRILDSLSTNLFSTKYWTHKIGGLYSYNDRTWMLNAGLYINRNNYSGNRGDYSGSYAEKTYNNLVTSILMRYNSQKDGQFFLSYNTRVLLPSIENLQQTLNNSNIMQLSIGNPDLKEAYIHSLMLSSSFGSRSKLGAFSVRGNATFVSDYNAKNTIIALSDTVVFDNILLQKGAQITRPVNLDNQMNLSLYLSYSHELEFLKSELYFELKYSYNKFPRGYNNVVDFSKNDSKGFEISLSDNRNLWFEYLIEVEYSIINTTSGNINFNNYSYREITSTLYFRLKIWNGVSLHSDSRYLHTTKGSGVEDGNNFLMNINLSRRFFNSTTELSFTVYDIFNNQKEIQKNINEFYVEERQSQLPRRCFLLTLSYNFGNFK